MAGAAATGAGLGIMGGILGGIGDIMAAEGHTNPKFPDATKAEGKFRKRTQQLLEQSRDVAEGGISQYNLLLPLLYDALGIEGDYIDNSGALETTLGELNASRTQLNDGQLRLKELNQLIKKGKGSDKQALQKEKRELKQSMRGLLQRLPLLERQVGELRSQPYQFTGLRPKAKTEEEQAQQRIQDALSRRVESALGGNLDDPRMLRELDEQERKLRENLRRDLGDGYEMSSPGIRALADFKQRRAELIDNANRQDIQQLRTLQMQGTTTLQDLTGNKQKLLSMIPQQQSEFGLTLADLGLANVRAQSPQQFDRQGTWQEQLQYVSDQEKQGQMMAQSGDRWVQVGNSVGGMGGK